MSVPLRPVGGKDVYCLKNPEAGEVMWETCAEDKAQKARSPWARLCKKHASAWTDGSLRTQPRQVWLGSRGLSLVSLRTPLR